MAAVLVANMDNSKVVTSFAKQGPLSEPKTMLNMATRLATLVFTNGNTNCSHRTIHYHASANMTVVQRLIRL